MNKKLMLLLVAGCVFMTTLACSFTRRLLDRVLPRKEETEIEVVTSMPVEEEEAVEPETVETESIGAEHGITLLDYSETPFTFINSSALETYIQGDYDPGSGIVLDAPSFEELSYYVETGWL